MTRRDSLLALLIALIWGTNFLFIDRGLESVPPLLFVALRFVLVCVPAVFFIPPPSIPIRDVVLIGVFMSAGQFGMVYLAMHLGMPTGLTPLVLQAQVLFTVVFASIALRDRPTGGQLIGVGVGAAGLIVVGIGRASAAPILSLLIVVGAAISWAIGNVIARRAAATSGLSLVVWSGTVVPLPLLGLSLLVEGRQPAIDLVTHPDWGAVGAALFTAYLASLLGYGLWNRLLATYSTHLVGPWTMLVPVVGMLAAALALGEVPNVTEVAGGLLLLLGVGITVIVARAKAGSRRDLEDVDVLVQRVEYVHPAGGADRDATR